jgi:DNA mismatch repair ATPase MutS
MKVLLLYPDHQRERPQTLPPQADALIQDLALTTLLNAMAMGDSFLFEVARTVLLNSLTDLETIHYRQAILTDCLRQPALIKELYYLTVEALESERKVYPLFFRDPSLVLSHSLQVLTILVDYLKKLRRLADEQEQQVSSAGLRNLFAQLQRELSDDYFAQVEEHLKELRFRRGLLISARLGPGNKGVDYTLRKPPERERSWKGRLFGPRVPAYTFHLDPRDESGARALGELRNRGLHLVADALARSSDHLLDFLTLLRSELAFYVGCLNLAEQLQQRGLPITFPVPVAAGERRHSYRHLYDPSLALTLNTGIVGNSGNADGKHLVIITGANQGGKTTFLRSIGLAQLMMQSGMFVAAEAFSANLCRGLFTHYKRREDSSMRSGKLDEELSRMSAIADQLTSDALLLLNESFAATNEREGSEIARQIVTALLEKRVKLFYVTHLYDFAHSFARQERPDVLFLRAERQADGARTFRLIVGDPPETGYGEDLYAHIFGEPQAQAEPVVRPSGGQAGNRERREAPPQWPQKRSFPETGHPRRPA